MDDRRFDDLIRSLSLKLPRRSLGPLGAGLLAALGAPDADAKRRRDRDRDRDRSTADQERDAAPRAATGPEAAKKKRRKKKKPKPPTCGNFGAFCTSSYGCCGALYCYDGRCAYSGTNPCPDDQYDCGGTCSWSSTCCPAGQKMCNGQCVWVTVCCPACGAGQTCVNGTCTGDGTPGCEAGTVACEGVCLPAGSCCPRCGADQTCSNGRCESIGIDGAELESCLGTVTDNASRTAATCQSNCADPGSSACETCLLGWLAGDGLGLFDCYGSVYDGPGTADEVSAAQNFGVCRQAELKTCYQRAFDSLPQDVKKELVDGTKNYIDDCLKTLPPKCEPIVATILKNLASAGAAASKTLFESIRDCWKAFGCRNGLFIPGVTAHRLCLSNNQCCLNGQKWDGDTCCWDGSECPVISGFMTNCCQRDSNDIRKTCLGGRCFACGIERIGRAEGDQCCVPDCRGKCGGDDACGGTCPDTCTAPQVCDAVANECCTPDCTGKCAGPDGCGGTCPNACPALQECDPSTATCCTPDCAGKCGGSNGCGGTCPTVACPTGQVCSASGQCTAVQCTNDVNCYTYSSDYGRECRNGVCQCISGYVPCGERMCIDPAISTCCSGTGRPTSPLVGQTCSIQSVCCTLSDGTYTCCNPNVATCRAGAEPGGSENTMCQCLHASCGYRCCDALHYCGQDTFGNYVCRCRRPCGLDCCTENQTCVLAPYNGSRCV